MQRIACFLFAAASQTLLFSCTSAYSRYLQNYPSEVFYPSPDYANLDYWAAHPQKKDLSDSIPLPLREAYRPDSSVDVFYLHPTTFTDSEDTAWNASLNNRDLNAKTDFRPILFQASVYNEYRVFAPRYRQANLRVYYTRDTADALRALDLAYADIKAAFQFYLDHVNHGRPIVIASHSQGSTHAQRLLQDFFDGKPLQQKLVAAYIIGMHIPQHAFSAIPACKDSTQTGCFAGWRTFRKGFLAPFVREETDNAPVVNPLSWGLTDEIIPRSENPGSVLLNFNKVIKHSAGAGVHESVLWTGRPKFPGSIFYRTRNYHIGDINLYYVSIRRNLRARVAAYFKNHS
jgi:hypothetical protein